MSNKKFGNLNVVNEINIGGSKLQQHSYIITYVTDVNLNHVIDSNSVESNINNIFLVDTSLGEFTVTLPPISNNLMITITDNMGLSSIPTNNINILTSNGDILRAQSVISTDYGSIRLVSIGNYWNSI